MKKTLLSLLLAVSILFTAVIGSANAIGSVTNKDISTANNEVTEEEFALPDIVKEVESEHAGYIGRVPEEEPDLNTFVFDNGDGTYTMRVYSHPVKYVDTNG